MIRKNEGYAFAVYSPDDKRKWNRAWGFIEDKRVLNLATADYGKKSTLNNILNMAVRSMALQLKVDNKGYQL